MSLTYFYDVFGNRIEVGTSVTWASPTGGQRFGVVASLAKMKADPDWTEAMHETIVNGTVPQSPFYHMAYGVRYRGGVSVFDYGSTKYGWETAYDRFQETYRYRDQNEAPQVG